MRSEQTRLPQTEREPEAEDGAMTDPAFQLYFSAMGPDNPLDDHQSQPGASPFGGIERLKNPVHLLFRNSPARIGDADPDTIGLRPGLHGQNPAARHRLHGIFD